MRVILKEKVKSLGNVGDIVNVSQGYGRNYLIPNKLAILADEQNKKFIEDQQRRLAKKIKDEKNGALELRKSINATTIEITKRVGGNGKLFGAVTASEMVSELAKVQIDAEKRWFQLDEPIKELGTFPVKVKIFADVEAELKVKVLMDPKQIEENKKKNEENKKNRKAKAEEGASSETPVEGEESVEAKAEKVEVVAVASEPKEEKKAKKASAKKEVEEAAPAKSTAKKAKKAKKEE